MAKKKSIGYKQAGVNIDEADRAVASIRTMARKTFSPRCSPISAASAADIC